MSSQPPNVPPSVPPFPPLPPLQPPAQGPQPGPQFAPLPPYQQPRSGSGARGCWIAAGIVGGVVLLFVLAVGFWFMQIYRTISDPATTATSFLAVNARSGPSSAYQLTSASFRLTTSEAAWTTYSQQYQLARYSSVRWNRFQINDDNASVTGVVKRDGLPDLPAKMELRRIDAVWRVSYVEMSGSTARMASPGSAVGPSSGSDASDMPSPTSGARSHDGDSGSSGSSPDSIGGGNGIGISDPQAARPPATSSNLPLGRPGPRGLVVASGVVGPSCISPLWTQGFRADSVRCPLYLDARPGASELCSAHSIDGRNATVKVTFLDHDPVTKLNKIDCRLN